MTKVYTNIRQCLTLAGVRQKDGRHPTESDLGVIDNAAVVVKGKKVDWVGPAKELPKKYSSAKKISAKNRVWLPSLIECHTHLIYGGSRVADYALRCQGKTYQDIAKAGGGILSTVTATRETSPKDLLARSLGELKPFEDAGLAGVEIKSGYGLTLDSEIKMLECIKAMQKKTDLHLVPTFLPAHAIPPEYKGKTDALVDAICSEWIPEVAKKKLAVFFDAFVEDGYFNVEQTRKMAQVAIDNGLKIKLHVDQFTDQKGTALGVELGAVSCDHLETVSDDGIKKIGGSDTVAVLAPGASIFTASCYAPARKLIDAGARVAITTDFNPGTCPSHNLTLMLTLSTCRMGMTIPEAITAATYNAAAALDLTEEFGSIEAGRPFHVTALDDIDFNALCYRFGETRTSSVAP